jgi:hypothetical protein
MTRRPWEANLQWPAEASCGREGTRRVEAATEPPIEEIPTGTRGIYSTWGLASHLV